MTIRTRTTIKLFTICAVVSTCFFKSVFELGVMTTLPNIAWFLILTAMMFWSVRTLVDFYLAPENSAPVANDN